MRIRGAAAADSSLDLDRPANARRRWFLASALGAAVILIAELVWRFRFETNDDLSFSLLMLGRAGRPPQGDFYFFFRGGLGELLTLLHSGFGAATLAYFELALLAFTAARWCERVLARRADDREPWVVAASLATGIWVIASTIWQLNFTRVAMLAAFVGFPGVARAVESPPPRRSAWPDLVLVLLGVAVRPHAGLLAIAFALGLDFIARRNWRRLVVRTAIAGVLAASFFVYDLAATSADDRPYVERVAAEARLLDFGADLSRPSDDREAFRLSAAANWMTFDDDTGRLIERHLEPRGATVRRRILAFDERAGSVLLAVHAFAGAWLWLALGIVVIELVVDRRVRDATTAVFQFLLLFAVLAALDVLFATRARVVEPLLAAACLQLLAQRRPGESPRRDRRMSVALMLVVAATIGWQAFNQSASRRQVSALRQVSNAALDAVDRDLRGRVVLATYGATLEGILRFQSPFAVRLPDPAIEIVLVQGWCTQFPEYRRQLDRFGEPGGVAGLLDAIARDPDRFAMIGTPDLVDLFVRYAAVVHGRRLAARSQRAGRLAYFTFESVPP